ncbi:reverse transcriptase family protein [Acanthopleuribacter pedis]|uniref:RNA-directed DNA polymerase n=1 Tax=Acanthopleuribacter pedis TaxID=442870 RepID=A0A8J7QCT6_9BACT|nr:reverse transcriptase family protein [Acanthopleuribacter pedis]MBO1317210.1 RNA-directed DNA polymerase [Acanthopleuribacter pedis]MBO1318516.1 RNA-directed DNA polymerase [Acanthopleuribacter pedis]
MNQARQALYDRIRESSKDEVILEEMIALGFWDPAQPGKEAAAELIGKTAELEREMSALRSEMARIDNQEAMLKALRKRNMEQAKARRVETKKRREAERQARAEAWRLKKQQDILYLGEGYSHSLGEQGACDAAALDENGALPAYENAAALAAAMGISIGELRWLAFGRKVSQTTHYQRFQVPKKSGGLRLISAPMPRLKEIQSWILREILEKVPIRSAARGFVRGKSIVDNARPHVGADVVINVDIKDFFPTVTYPRVKGVFRKLGYRGQVATILAMLTTEPEMVALEMDGQRYWMAKGERRLPQGAPSSPALTNIICRGLDAELEELALVNEYEYTRYADDITFSTRGREANRRIGGVLRKIEQHVGAHGFTLHPDKTKVLRNNARQEVTGIVVNEKLSVDRKTLRRFRAVMFQVEQDGPEGKHWGQAEHVIAGLTGYAHFLKMVDPARAQPFLEQLARIVEKHGNPVYPERRAARAPSWRRYQPDSDQAEATDAAPAANEAPAHPSGSEGEAATPVLEKKPWWKFW